MSIAKMHTHIGGKSSSLPIEKHMPEPVGIAFPPRTQIVELSDTYVVHPSSVPPSSFFSSPSFHNLQRDNIAG